MAGKRRKNGEGSIRELDNGSWEARIMIGRQPDGKKKMKTFTRKTCKDVYKRQGTTLRVQSGRQSKSRQTVGV